MDTKLTYEEYDQIRRAIQKAQINSLGRQRKISKRQFIAGIAFMIIGIACSLVGHFIYASPLEYLGLFVGVTGLYMIVNSLIRF